MKQKILAPFRWEDISRYKNEIYGFSILWIMLFHAKAILGLDYTLGGFKFLEELDLLIGDGNVGVEVFLFCSGIYLYFSYYRNPDIGKFIVKRFTRLFLPVIIITGGYWCWKWLLVEPNILKLFSKLTMLDFWISGDQQSWFVAFIFVCYILYPYIYVYFYESKFLNSCLRLIILLGIVGGMTLSLSSVYPDIYRKIEIGFTRFPVFILGCFAGKYVYDKRILSNWTYLWAVIVFWGSRTLLHKEILEGAWRRWMFIAIGASALVLFIWILNVVENVKLQKFLSFFGEISLNLYVAHILMIRLYKLTPFYENCRLAHYAVVLLVSVLVAWATEKIINLILTKRG